VSKEILNIELQKQGITNPVVIQGILGVVGTESNYVPKSEVGYRNTPVERIRLIFGSRLAKYTDAQINALKANDVAFFDVIYGKQYGNNLPGDGWKYRGRGYNGLTFKDNYSYYGKKIGIDLVANPDKANESAVASKIAAVYFADIFNRAKANGSLLAKTGVTDISQIKTKEQAVTLALQANAGWNKNINTTFYQSVAQKALNFIKDNPVKSGGGVALILLAVGLFFLVRNKKRKKQNGESI
jgi:predicted chitinase